ncbi:SDR family NAD(P)-dependent oxidoreductase [Yinghuangia seranimata]|uniref:SDR family NAD(P)-dependent oxidoreductase n=1 Tax=Yinghuangia seranimata TaxID=408067 RepID=UPI00248B7777|nr:SDR family oxidoreductase [Yinghuangia seranimata]MDI2128527.1 SDR family oxidoreductase [Yinghuangia seranimata]
MLNPEPLAGRVAIVTGGGAGIGGGVSRLLARAGAVVVLNDIDAGYAEAAAKDIAEAGGRAVTVVGDIREPETVARLRDAALAATPEGRVDVLVNNVGDYRPSSTFLRSTEEDWAASHAINFEHVLRVTHAILPTMIEGGAGSIVNVSTVEALRGIPGCPVYSAYNAAIIAFTKSLAVDVGRKGVRVNCIAPDLAQTLQTPYEAMLRGRDPKLIGSWVPLGRFGEPEDYARVVLFLASDDSAFVTGHLIPVDGGTTAASGWYGKADGRGWTNLPDQA